MECFFYWVMQLFLLSKYTIYIKGYNFRAHSLGILFYATYLAVFLNHVYQSLGDMKIHGLVYGITLSFYGSLTIMQLLNKVTLGNVYLFFGVFIFSVRDVLLTYNKRYFYEDIFTYSVTILHIAGFFLIIKAFMRYEDYVSSQVVKNA